MDNNKVKKAIEQLNKLGKEKIASVASYVESVEAVPSGVESLDLATGIGGFPVGRISEIHGIPGVSKTSLCYKTIATNQKLGKVCLFVDAEHTFDISHAASIGVDVDNLIVMRPSSGEEAFEAIEKMVDEKLVDIVVVDSVPSLIPTPELEAEVNKPTMGGQARLIASGLRRLVPKLSKQRVTLIFINQLRVNIMGGPYNPYTLPGGMSLGFYLSLRIELKRMGAIKKGDEQIGLEVKFVVKKNKCHNRNEDGTYRYFMDGSFDSNVDLIGNALKFGVLTREGNTYYFEGNKIAIGKEKVSEALKNDEALLSSVQESLQRQLRLLTQSSPQRQSSESHSE